MRNKPSTLRTILGALVVAGAMGAACSSSHRHSNTTVAQAPLGLSTADYPANPSVAPPDAAQAPEQAVGPVRSLSPGAVRGSTQGAPTNSTPTNTIPAGPDTGPNGTPTAVPAPTPASPNAPSSTPSANPIPPTGGGPTSGTGGTSEPGGGGTTGGSAMSTFEPSDGPVSGARGTFYETVDPYQARRDGGVTPPAPIRDGGVGPGGRGDAGIGGGGGGRGDAGVGGIGGRGDAGGGGGTLRSDAGGGGGGTLRGDGGVR